MLRVKNYFWLSKYQALQFNSEEPLKVLSQVSLSLILLGTSLLRLPHVLPSQLLPKWLVLVIIAPRSTEE